MRKLLFGLIACTSLVSCGPQGSSNSNTKDVVGRGGATLDKKLEDLEVVLDDDLKRTLQSYGIDFAQNCFVATSSVLPDGSATQMFIDLVSDCASPMQGTPIASLYYYTFENDLFGRIVGNSYTFMQGELRIDTREGRPAGYIVKNIQVDKRINSLRIMSLCTQDYFDRCTIAVDRFGKISGITPKN
jgi:hypothetical protein